MPPPIAHIGIGSEGRRVSPTFDLLEGDTDAERIAREYVDRRAKRRGSSSGKPEQVTATRTTPGAPEPREILTRQQWFQAQAWAPKVGDIKKTRPAAFMHKLEDAYQNYMKREQALEAIEARKFGMQMRAAEFARSTMRTEKLDQRYEQGVAKQDTRYEEGIDYRNRQSALSQDRHTESMDFSRERAEVSDTRYGEGAPARQASSAAATRDLAAGEQVKAELPGDPLAQRDLMRRGRAVPDTPAETSKATKEQMEAEAKIAAMRQILEQTADPTEAYSQIVKMTKATAPKSAIDPRGFTEQLIGDTYTKGAGSIVGEMTSGSARDKMDGVVAAKEKLESMRSAMSPTQVKAIEGVIRDNWGKKPLSKRVKMFAAQYGASPEQAKGLTPEEYKRYRTMLLGATPFEAAQNDRSER
ncbi:MAG: hypothetical protein V3S47_02630 [Acidobacteriota bacterium]